MLESALARNQGRASDLELCFIAHRIGATRFSSSQITQSAHLEEPLLQVRIARGQMIGATRARQAAAIGPSGFESALTPAVALKGFHFTGSASHG